MLVVYLYTHIHVCIHVCMYVCMYIHVYISTRRSCNEGLSYTPGNSQASGKGEVTWHLYHAVSIHA